MRTPLGTLVLRYRTLLAACQRPLAARLVLAVVAMSAALPASAMAQRAEGAIGVSLVVTAPVEIVTLAITELRVDRNGVATIRSTSPAAASPVIRPMPARPAALVRRKLLVVAGT